MQRREFLAGIVSVAGAYATTPGGNSDSVQDGLASRLRTRSKFDFDWKFFKGDAPGADRPEFSTTSWRGVSVPHDWSIEGPFDKDAPSGGSFGYLPTGIGWYRKEFELPVAGKDRIVLIEFDGVYHNSDVWLNGHHLGRRPYGYISFCYDLTPHLRFGAKNVLAVKVDNSDQPNCRWYSGSGIYRHVWLTETAAVHVAHWGTYLTTPSVSEARATVRIRTWVENSLGTPQTFSLETTILNPSGEAVGKAIARGSASPGSSAEIAQEFPISRPELWSPETPGLYKARSVVLVEGKPVDEYATPFGIREVRFDGEKGLLLNGRSMKMKGVCLHHDGGSVGAAVPDRVLERRLQVLKSVGCNAIRTSHNPPAPELLDMCDRMGFLVIDEAFDGWRGRNNRSFAEWWERDLSSMLERDRNHPSIVLWSVGNEAGEPGSEFVNQTTKMLVDFVHGQEPSRRVTCVLVMPLARKSGKLTGERVDRVMSTSKFMDVLGVNYQEPYFPLFRKADPNVIVIGTEVFKYWRSTEDNLSAFDPMNTWWDVVRHDYVAGQFLWTGIDYFGEFGGFPRHGSTCGIIDSCGFLKPEGMFQRSVWGKDPLVFIAVLNDSLGSGTRASAWDAPIMLPHWNFPQYQGQLLRLQTQTNCETLELVLNGTSYGVRRAANYLNRAVIWHVPYQPGKIEAIGRTGGEIVARRQLLTSGPCGQIVLRPDRRSIAADGQDVSHVEVNLADREGVLVPDDDRTIRFELNGPGDIIGVDNGNMLSLEPYKANSRRTVSGRCLLIVQSTREPGVIRLVASASGLPSVSATIDTV